MTSFEDFPSPPLPRLVSTLCFSSCFSYFPQTYIVAKLTRSLIQFPASLLRSNSLNGRSAGLTPRPQSKSTRAHRQHVLLWLRRNPAP